MKVLNLNLQEAKKWSGKYVVEGTEDDQWPTILYLKKEWFPDMKLPRQAEVTIATKGEFFVGKSTE